MPETEGLLQRLWRRFVGYRLGTGGAFMSTLELPPSLNYEKYLQMYGQVGWLFGAVSTIAQSVGAVDWHLYRKKKGGRDEIPEHTVLDLLDYVNPFQTRVEFMELLQTYIGLVGEAFIQMNFKGAAPAELWLAPPQFMFIVPDERNYIKEYRYRRGGADIVFEIPEIIHVMSPNPLNPMRGLGAAQSIGVDLDTERYAIRHQQRVFYNDAMPNFIIEYPDMPPKDEREDIIELWNKTHRGWANARRTGFLWGGAKPHTVTISNKDMDYWRLRKINRETILGTFRIPTSIMGLAEVGSRARAEADEYIYAKRVVKPALMRIREALNEQFIPLFRDDGLELDFEDPVPENREALVGEAKELFKEGLITREEARDLLGYDIKPEGTFVMPLNVIEVPAGKGLVISGNGHGPVDKAADEKEVAWRKYAERNLKHETKLMLALRKLWNEQRDAILERLENGIGGPDMLLFGEEADDEIAEGLRPVLTDTFIDGAREAEERASEKAVTAFVTTIDGADALAKAVLASVDKQISLDEFALNWLANYSLQQAKLVNGTTREQLRAVLAEEYRQGHSTKQIEKAIRQYYQNGYQKRARLVARTETIAASNEGALQTYEKIGVERVEFYAALDERTCEECSGYHGEVVAVSDSHGLIPIHPQCRCDWIPVKD